MIKRIKQYFDANIRAAFEGQADEAADTQQALQRATAALMIEVMEADREVTADERQVVMAALKKLFDLNTAEIEDLMALAQAEVNASGSLFQFTKLVDQAFDNADKVKIVHLLWQISYADDDKDKFEEGLIRKIADLLHVSHSDFIRTRHLVETSLGKT